MKACLLLFCLVGTHALNMVPALRPASSQRINACRRGQPLPRAPRRKCPIAVVGSTPRARAGFMTKSLRTNPFALARYAILVALPIMLAMLAYALDMLLPGPSLSSPFSAMLVGS